MPRQLLVETFAVNLKEAKVTKLANGAVRVEGVKAQHCNVKNKNGRRYPSTWTYAKHLKEDAGFNRRIARNEVFGHIEHPSDGRASLREAALIVEKAWMEGDEVFITYRTTTNTLGKELAALTRDGLNYGLSSRATGSVKKAEDGVDEVQEDFEPETWDAVSDPSTPGARLVRERIEEAYRQLASHGGEHHCAGCTEHSSGKCLCEAEASEGGFKLNCATLPLDKARAYAEEEFTKSGKKLDDVIPDFDKNYTALQKACKKALDVPRVEMPVIEPTDMAEFDKRLDAGHIDVFKPYAKGHLVAPGDMSKAEGDEWVTLGVKDGDPKDDVIKGKWTEIPAKDLLPTQSQIWLEKLIANIVKWGVPAQGSSLTKTTIIASKEGYILDGHHRYGQAMLAKPDLKLKALYVPLDIKILLKIGRAYGAAIGNRPKESVTEVFDPSKGLKKGEGDFDTKETDTGVRFILKVRGKTFVSTPVDKNLVQSQEQRVKDELRLAAHQYFTTGEISQMLTQISMESATVKTDRTLDESYIYASYVPIAIEPGEVRKSEFDSMKDLFRRLEMDLSETPVRFDDEGWILVHKRDIPAAKEQLTRWGFSMRMESFTDEMKKKITERMLTEDARQIHREMKQHLQKEFRAMFDDADSFDFDAEAAIYWFASDNHGGQGSDLYGVLSVSDYRPGASERGVEGAGELAAMMYTELEDWAKKNRVESITEGQDAETVAKQLFTKYDAKDYFGFGGLKDVPQEIVDQQKEMQLNFLRATAKEIAAKAISDKTRRMLTDRNNQLMREILFLIAGVDIRKANAKQAADALAAWEGKTESVQESRGERSKLQTLPSDLEYVEDDYPIDIWENNILWDTNIGVVTMDFAEKEMAEAIEYAVKHRSTFAKTAIKFNPAKKKYVLTIDGDKRWQESIQEAAYFGPIKSKRDADKIAAALAGRTDKESQDALAMLQRNWQYFAARPDIAKRIIALAGLEGEFGDQQESVTETAGKYVFRSARGGDFGGFADNRVDFTRVFRIEMEKAVTRDEISHAIEQVEDFMASRTIRREDGQRIIADLKAKWRNEADEISEGSAHEDMWAGLIRDFMLTVGARELTKEEIWKGTLASSGLTPRGRAGQLKEWRGWFDKAFSSMVKEDAYFDRRGSKYSWAANFYGGGSAYNERTARMRSHKAENSVQISEATTKLVNGMKERIKSLESLLAERDEKIRVLEELNEAMDDLKRRESLTAKLDALLSKYPQLIKAQHILANAKTVEHLDRLADECLALMLEERKQRETKDVKKEEKGATVNSVKSAAESGSSPLTAEEGDSLSRLTEKYKRDNKTL